MSRLGRETLQHYPDRAKLALLAATDYYSYLTPTAGISFPSARAKLVIETGVRVLQKRKRPARNVKAMRVAPRQPGSGEACAPVGAGAAAALDATVDGERWVTAVDQPARAMTAGNDHRHLLLWAAAGQMQAGDLDSARALTRQALQAGADRRAAARLLLGGAYTQLGRAALRAERPAQAVRNLRVGLELGVPGGAALSTDLLMAEAERCSRRGEDREAVRRWQDIAGLLGEKTPEWVYSRLSEAMAQNAQGYGGTAEENRVWGDRHKHDLLTFFHAQLQPALYLEIGVDAGLGLARATGRAIGVDPRPRLDLKVTLGESVKIVPLSSDAFFREQAAALLQPPPELVFIDGMHLFEFALRDFMNVERYACPWTLVTIDDIYPCHPAQADRRRRTGSWTGDVWKLHRILRERRPDLTLLALNAETTGLLLIAGLDPDNRVLWEDYAAIVRRYADAALPPEVLERQGAVASDTPVLEQWLDILRQARREGWMTTQVQQRLHALMSQADPQCAAVTAGIPT